MSYAHLTVDNEEHFGLGAEERMRIMMRDLEKFRGLDEEDDRWQALRALRREHQTRMPRPSDGVWTVMGSVWLPGHKRTIDESADYADLTHRLRWRSLLTAPDKTSMPALWAEYRSFDDR